MKVRGSAGVRIHGGTMTDDDEGGVGVGGGVQSGSDYAPALPLMPLKCQMCLLPPLEGGEHVLQLFGDLGGGGDFQVAAACPPRLVTAESMVLLRGQVAVVAVG